MQLFGLKNARKKLSSPSLSSLGLRKTQSTGNIEDPTATLIDNTKEERPIHIIVNRRGKHASSDTTMVSILRTPNQPPTPPLQSTIVLAPVMEDEHDEALASKLRDITACDMDLLLSLETQARMDVQEEKERRQLDSKPPRLIKFDIPVTPPRSRSPDPNFIHARQRRWSLPEDSAEVSKKTNNNNNTRLSRWSRLIKQQQQEEANHNKKLLQNSSTITSNSCSSNSSDEDIVDDTFVSQQQQINIGSKVKLFKRPLPIIGTVKYIGPVHFDIGEWLGIELDSRGKISLLLYIYILIVHCSYLSWQYRW